ncbi:MAG: hexitol phosphatase HxpB [Patescibacteria group bacterium]
MIKAVIFDMDGLLIDSEPLWRKAQAQAFKTVGIEPTDEDYDRYMGRGIKEVVEQWYHEKPWESPSQKEIEDLIVEDLIALVKSEGKLRKGVQQAIDICKAASLPMAIASSSYNLIIDATVDRLEIREHFDHLHSAEHETHSKPHPAVFITTAELLGVVPQDCLVFEDSPSGVLAAKAAKMKCVAVPESSVREHPYILTADVVIDSLEEFTSEMLAEL